MKPEVWNPLSRQAREFTEALLNRNAKTRLTAKSALAHPWIKENCRDKQPLLQNPQDILDALSAWDAVPKLRRACLTMIAWSLSDGERANFQDYFLALDSDHNGAISYSELQKVMTETCGIDQSKMKPIFDNLHLDSNDEIRYSDFIAVFMSTKVEKVDDGLLQTAFRKFDKNNVGYLTCDDFADMTGLERDFVSASSILGEKTAKKEDVRIDYYGFKDYITRKVRRSSKIARDRVASKLHGKVGADRDSKVKSRLDAMKEAPVAQQQCCTLM
jgi:Ca2+-binding EF-hand superfamily protein